ncbi:hypothetical protein CBS101457_002289 [Exobasidium rhododendri]|nr:hypothetical protein CBS101457_002289 [Exobasidium rhododendri]
MTDTHQLEKADVVESVSSEHHNEKSGYGQQPQLEEGIHDAERAKWAAREEGLEVEEKEDSAIMIKVKTFLHSKTAVVIRDFGLIALILGWWIPAVINDAHQVRHRIIPSSIIAWFLILLILLHNSKYIPQRPLVRILVTGWSTVFGKPWSKLTRYGKLGLGWGALVVLVFGTTYGLPVSPTSSYGSRTISLVGLALIYGALFASSNNHSAVQARTTILGIGFQFIIALFVFRTGAGYSFFGWIATAAADLLAQGYIGGATFFWSASFVANSYFFVNTLASIIFFVALCIALFYTGVLTWVIRKAAWFFFQTFGISGAEAVVAVASPFIGQGENLVLVRPYARLFTRSEFHQVLVSGFATIAGSVLGFYISLGISGQILVSSSVMSIPASIAASKMRYPETQESETARTVVVERHEAPEERSIGVLHALSNGAWFGLKVAAAIFGNVLVLLSTVYAINGILAYIGNAWYITASNGGPLSLQLIFSYVLWPVAFMLGTPGSETLAVSRLIAEKIITNEFVAYLKLKAITEGPSPLSQRATTIASYALCGFGNIGSVGINIGVMTAIAPKRSGEIVRLAPSALITGILVTLSSAAVAGIVSSD